MKQGAAGRHYIGGRKVEPSSKAVNPAGVADIGIQQGNHATDAGTFQPQTNHLNAGRGYSAPSIGITTHQSGSQGKHK